MASTSIWVLTSLAGLASAQFPPKPEGITLLRSKFHENVTLSFKEASTILFRFPGMLESPHGTLLMENICL